MRILSSSFLSALMLMTGLANAQRPAITAQWLRKAGDIELGAPLSVVEDTLGFMWFGTIGGLYKYDGYGFTVYVHDPDDSTSLSNNWVEHIYEDRDGILWVATADGLNRYDRESDTFSRFMHDPDDPTSIAPGKVRLLYEDRNGFIWVSADPGLHRLDKKSGTFTHHLHPRNDPPEMQKSWVREMIEDRNGRFWIGTSEIEPNGVYRYDPKTETFAHFSHQEDNPRSLYNNSVEVIHEDAEGNIWVGTWGASCIDSIPSEAISNAMSSILRILTASKQSEKMRYLKGLCGAF